MALHQPKKTISFDSITRWVDPPPVKKNFAVVWVHKLLRITLITIREFELNNLSLRSGALTYTILLSMVPMLAMSTAVVKGLGGGNQLREVVYKYIETLEQSSPLDLEIPDKESDTGPPPLPSAEDESAGLTTHLRSAADQLFDYVDRTSFATLGTFGMLGIFLSVILVLNHIEAAMNAIWQVEAGRSLIRKVTDYLTLMVLMPISLNVALAAGTIVESQYLTIHIDKFIPIHWIQLVLLKGVPVFFLSITLYIVYLFFPNTKPKAIPTLIGAVLAGTLWFITQNIYIGLQIGVAKYNAIYGSFATVPLFLVWIYFGCLFVLLGAQVAYAIEKNDRYQLIKKNDAPSIKLSAALDLCSAIKRSFQDNNAIDLDSVHQEYPAYTLEQLEEARDTLVSAGFLHHSRESEKLMPSLPPQSITPKIVIEAVLGTITPDSFGGKVSAEAVQAATNSNSRKNESTDEPAKHQETDTEKSR
jgi:membrane protein